MYWFSSTCYRYVLPSLALYPGQVNTQKRKNMQILIFFFRRFVSEAKTPVFLRKIFPGY